MSAIPAGAISTTNMPGLAGTTTTGNNQRMRNLLSFLAGSLSQVTQFYYMQAPTKLDTFEDYKTFPQRIRDTHQNEVQRLLQRRLEGAEESHAQPRRALGLLRSAVRRPRPDAAPGWRPRRSLWNLRESFDDWMKPGVRGEPTVIEFVGKNSPNPDTPWYPND